jgi:hypothetical protein
VSLVESTQAFYLPKGDGFESTVLTRGPWDPRHQHVGPPAALLARALERAAPRDDAMFTRVTVDILKPVPIAPVRCEVRCVRPGKSVELFEGALFSGGDELLKCRAWRIRTAEVPFDAPAPPPAPPGPEQGSAAPFFEGTADEGYHTGMDGRFVRGSFREPGPALAWLRMAAPLVAGEAPLPLSRVLIAADSGNGVSSPLDARRYLFINTELTVHLHRYPEGEWVALDATSWVEPHGVGLTETALSDVRSRIGRAHQSLFVAARGV